MKKINSAQKCESVELVNNCDFVSTVNNKFWVTIEIEKVQLKMEFDSGSPVSIIDEFIYKKYFLYLSLLHSQTKLRTYSGNFLTVLGYIEVKVVVGTDCRQGLKLYVVAGKKCLLFDREWIRAFTWNNFKDILASEIHSVSTNNETNNSLRLLLNKYSSLFDKEHLGEIKGEPVTLHLKKGSQPIFYRARPVPFALKEKVEQEIDNLVNEGVLIKVDCSDYATPIVPVVKANGKIRLCGDYKLTLNQQLIVDEHPLPTSDELLNGLAGGEKFTKIDLRNAYLQWRVREEDQSLLTINTHKGLYKCTRLMYGLNCAPAKWQRKIENIFKGIPGVNVFIDVTKITGLIIQNTSID